MKLSDYVMSRLAGAGARHVFFVPGGGAMHLNDALGRAEGLVPISMHHEQSCAIAADAYARAERRVGAALVTTGPGGTNAVTGVAASWVDSIPVVIVSGQVKRADLRTITGVRQMGAQEIDIISMVTPITKYARLVDDPSRIRYELDAAFAAATSPRGGPVWIDIPLDVQAAQIDPDALEGFVPPSSQPASIAGDVAKLVAALQQAERPVLLVGHGVRLARAESRLIAVAERLGIPVLTTWLAMDILADDHPLHFGRPGSIAPRGANFTLQNADLLLVLGARLDQVTTGYAHERFARHARKFVVDVDAAELGKLRMPVEAATCCDVGDYLIELERQLPKMPERTAWLARCREWKARYPLLTDDLRAIGDRVTTYAFTDALSDALREDDVLLPGSSGAAIEIVLLCFRARRGQKITHAGGLGAMGFGIPGAIGACLATGRRTVCTDGDGGFLMNVQELQTVKRLGLPTKFFVLNNEGYASIRTSQTRHFGKLVGADATSGLTLPSLEKIAAAFELPFERIATANDVAAGLRRVLDAKGPVVCEVLIPPTEPRQPSILSRQRPDGTMASSRMEDLWPFLSEDELRANMIGYDENE